MEGWTFVGQQHALLLRLGAVDPLVPAVLKAVESEVRRFDGNIFLNWEQQEIAQRVQTYVLRYVLPLYELARVERSHLLVEGSVIQLLSCVLWRHFDNVLDHHRDLAMTSRHLVHAAGDLCSYSLLYANRDVRRDVAAHCDVMVASANCERESPLCLSDIWMRCSIFLLAAQDVLGLSTAAISLMKQYINYTGVAHDAHDLISDIERRVLSLPYMWLLESDRDQVLNVRSVKALYSRLQLEVEPLEREFQRLRVAEQYPIMWDLISESRRTIHDVE